MDSLAPVILFAYNRPRHLQQTINALAGNALANQSDLIVYSDGAKKEDDIGVKNVRDYLKTIYGFKTISIVERERNYGLAESIMQGVTETIKKYKRVIVLEDDLVTSPYFLTYMNRSLYMYQDDNRVASIHGYVYPIHNLPETFFLKGADCWGWATWDRAWSIFNPNGKELLNQIQARNLESEFDFNNSSNYIRMLMDQIKGKNNSWAVRWYASAFVNNMYTLYPGKSLVYNIGNDYSGTHSEKTSRFDVELANTIQLSKIAVEENKMAKKSFEQYFKPNMLSRIKSKFNQWVG